jgi:pyruvate dehydrogenase E1 component alpha subunit
MHLLDVKTRLLGGYAIVGGQIPLATGAALAISYRGGDEVVMCQMGDGTTNIGAFHECLNMAAIWRLPIVFVVVNNLLGMGTKVEWASAEPELYKRAAAYRMPGERVDGLDVLAVRDATRRHVERARTHQQPSLLEAVSYRLRGHSVVDPAKYRAPEEVEQARAGDPIALFARTLIDAGVLDEATAVKLDADVGQQVNVAVEFAEASPQPDPSTLFAYTYATPVANEHRHMPGDPVVSA